MSNALAKAILDGDIAHVRALIKESPELLKSRSDSGQTMLALAEHKGVCRTVAVLLHAHAPGSSSYTTYQSLLRCCLQEFSFEWTTASWYDEIEDILWALASGEMRSYRISEDHNRLFLSREEQSEWMFLARKANGWPTFNGFLSLEDWEARHKPPSKV